MGYVWVLGTCRSCWTHQWLHRAFSRKTTWVRPTSIRVKQFASVDPKEPASPGDFRPTLPGPSRLVYHSTKIGEYASGTVLDHEHRLHVPWIRPVRRQPLVRHLSSFIPMTILMISKVSYIPATALEIHRRPCRSASHRPASSGVDLRHT
jgi:hypothetical protein